MPDSPRVTSRRLLTALPLVVLVGVVAVLVAVRAARGPGDDPTAPGATTSIAALPTGDRQVAEIVDAATRVPADVLDAVGTGGVATVPIAVNGEAVTDAEGTPRIVWVGSEDCATCAAMRWATVVALSRFGRFDGLGLVASAADAPYPGTVGPTFRDATYDSSRLAVTFYESEQGDGAPSNPVSAADRALITRYDGPPYVADDDPRPFVLFAGQYVSAGTLIAPGVLDGLGAADVAAALSDPASAAGRAIDGAANVLTAVLCVTTGGEPGDVCDSAGVRTAARVIGVRNS